VTFRPPFCIVYRIDVDRVRVIRLRHGERRFELST
jgi:hypothetical protein